MSSIDHQHIEQYIFIVIALRSHHMSLSALEDMKPILHSTVENLSHKYIPLLLRP